MEDEIWTTRDGRALKVGDMEEAHVRDALRFVLRKRREARAVRLVEAYMRKMLARLDVDFDADEAGEGVQGGKGSDA